jgi:hypothetical protein
MSAKYILEPYKGKNTRYTCPNCQKPYQFTRYINIEKQQYLPEVFGICNRFNKCGYAFYPTPENLSKYNNDETSFQIKYVEKKKDVKYIAKSLFDKSLNHYEQNEFWKFIENLHPDGRLALQKYHVGTSNIIKGATIFWQIDLEGNIGQGQIIQYDSRCKKTGLFNSVHNLLKINDLKPEQILFGLWLLNSSKDKPVAIVEAPKTAIIASLFYPQYIWLATFGYANLTEHKLKHFINRKIVLFPDLKSNGENVWKTKAEVFTKKGFNIIYNDFLETIATKEQKCKGFDLADFLIITHFEENPHLNEALTVAYNYYVFPSLTSEKEASIPTLSNGMSLEEYTNWLHYKPTKAVFE